MRNSLTLRGLAAAVALLALSLPGQTPFAQVEILNTTGMAGLTTADVVIPLKKGQVMTIPQLRTDQDKICHVRPLGARWPDNSHRYLRVDLPVEVQPGERRVIKLNVDTGPTPTFSVHPVVATGLANVKTWFLASKKRVEFTNPMLIEDTPRMRVYRRSVRIPDSCMWAQLDYLVMHDTPHVRFYLQWGQSNPIVDELYEDPGLVSMETQGAKFVFEEPDTKLHHQYEIQGIDGNVLHTGGWIADGQAQCLEGRITFGAGAPRVRAMAFGWSESAAFGPFGELVPGISLDQNWWQELVDYENFIQARIPWAAPRHGCSADPSLAGSQQDFGTIVMRPDLLLHDPSRLKAIARSVYQEWCRPTHFREFSLERVTKQAHPQLFVLSGRPHFSIKATTVDLLGKKGEYLDSSKVTYDESRRSWRGHDAEHLSLNYLVGFAMTTGDRLALEECSHLVELFLAEFTEYTHPTVRPGAARMVGRSLLAGSWLWLITGRQDLKDRLVTRAQSVPVYYKKPRAGVPSILPKVLVPRQDATRGHYWPPWEEAIAAVGLCAVDALFDLPECAEAAISISENVVMHGMGRTSWGWRVGYKIPIEGAENEPYRAITDPLFESVHSSGGGLTRWTMPSVVIAAVHSPDPAIRNYATSMFFEMFQDQGIYEDQRLLEWLAVLKKH